MEMRFAPKAPKKQPSFAKAVLYAYGDSVGPTPACHRLISCASCDSDCEEECFDDLRGWDTQVFGSKLMAEAPAPPSAKFKAKWNSLAAKVNSGQYDNEVVSAVAASLLPFSIINQAAMDMPSSGLQQLDVSKLQKDIVEGVVAGSSPGWVQWLTAPLGVRVVVGVAVVAAAAAVWLAVTKRASAKRAA